MIKEIALVFTLSLLGTGCKNSSLEPCAKTSTISGHISAADSSPLGEVEVYCCSASERAKGYLVKSDSSGNYTFTEQYRGTLYGYRVVFKKTGYTDGESEFIFSSNSDENSCDSTTVTGKDAILNPSH